MIQSTHLLLFAYIVGMMMMMMMNDVSNISITYVFTQIT